MNLYKIENKYILATISDYGARIIELISKKHNNIDIVDGMEFNEEKLRNCPEPYFSATVGPICNRIEYGTFKYNN